MSAPATQQRIPAGATTGGQFAATVHAEADTGLEHGYHGAHTAPANDGYSSAITELTKAFPEDVYEHPEWYGSGEVDAETMAQLLKARDNPEATVRVYRALPPDVGRINRSDWITLSRAYAQEHAIQDSEAANDWPVIHADVPAATVFSDGNDLMEFGYDGPDLDCAGVPGGH